MATTKITEKPTATQVNEDLFLFVSQKENVSGEEKDSLRRMSQNVYEWSALPADIRLAIQVMITAMRQTDWGNDERFTDLENWITENADNQERITQLENWATTHKTVETGIKTLTNTLAFPFNNSQQTVALTKQQPNGDYIVMADITAHSGNVGEIEITDKLTNGFKIAYTGSATSVSVKYVVIGGFAE